MFRYSQRDEQDVILEVFKDYATGRFLDIGAYDGKTLSNTYALAELGWFGVCIEPSPKNFKELKNNYPDMLVQGIPVNKIICMDVAVGLKDEATDFFDTPGDFYGSLTQGNGVRYGKQEVVIKVNCITCDSLFKMVGYNFDFISLDVEQNNFDVLKNIPFNKLTRLKLICVEHDSKESQIEEFLKPLGFVVIHRTEENILLERDI